MENRQILKTLVLLLLCFPQTACTGGGKEPTAIVIDAETGKPIEGAIALAQWYRAVSLGFGLGGSLALDKAQEAISDKDGKINIDGYWGLYIFSRQPGLTVYKPGYVLWDSQRICPFGERTDFDKNQRTVKLLKFEPEAARWLYEYPERVNSNVGPRNKHMSFFNLCYTAGDKFQDIFRASELPLANKEALEERQKFEERKKSK
jgi:hypothetical protein